MAESKPVTPALDLAAIRAGLEAYDAAYADYIKRGESLPNLAAYVLPSDIRALVAEVERLTEIATGNAESFSRMCLKYQEENKYLEAEVEALRAANEQLEKLAYQDYNDSDYPKGTDHD